MSTKIYNGIKFRSGDIREILNQLISMRGKAARNSMSCLAGPCFDSCYDVIRDMDLPHGSKEDEYIARFKIESALQDNFAKDRRTMSDPDFNFFVCVYPAADGIYGYYFCDRIKENENLILSIADDFSYWDNQDPPKSVSEVEWQRRRAVWDEIFSEDDTFSGAGFTYRVVNPNMRLDSELLKKLLCRWKEEHDTVKEIPAEGAGEA